MPVKFSDSQSERGVSSGPLKDRALKSLLGRGRDQRSGGLGEEGQQREGVTPCGKVGEDFLPFLPVKTRHG